MNVLKKMILALLAFSFVLGNNVYGSHASSSSQNQFSDDIEGLLLIAERSYLGLVLPQDMQMAKDAVEKVRSFDSVPEGTEAVVKRLSQRIEEAESGHHHPETALDYYMQLASEGSAWHRVRANQTLGMMYHDGLGGATKNLATAEEYYLKAADQELNKIAQAWACHGLSRLFDAATDSEQAKKYVKYIEMAAKQSIEAPVQMLARVQLGRMYYFGQGVKQDKNRANFYLNEPALQDENLAERMEACALLARHFPMSQQDPHSISPLLSELLKVRTPQSLHDRDYIAKYGAVFPEADVFLGKLYYEGKFVPQSDAIAIDFLKRVVSNSEKDIRASAEACVLLGKIYLKDRKTYSEAHTYLQRATDQNVDPAAEVEAYALLGDMYYRGHGVKKNFAKALNYLRNALNVSNNTETLKQVISNIEGIAHQEQNMKVHFLAQWALMQFYNTGLGNIIEKNDDKVLDYLYTVAVQTDVPRMSDSALKNLEDAAQAPREKKLVSKAYQYFIEAHWALAQLHDKGHELGKAVDHLKVVAEQRKRKLIKLGEKALKRLKEIAQTAQDEDIKKKAQKYLKEIDEIHEKTARDIVRQRALHRPKRLQRQSSIRSSRSTHASESEYLSAAREQRIARAVTENTPLIKDIGDIVAQYVDIDYTLGDKKPVSALSETGISSGSGRSEAETKADESLRSGEVGEGTAGSGSLS